MRDNNKTYKSIGDVARILNLVNKKTGKLSTHTLRFWEKKFKDVKPHFFSGNRRYYDENNILLLKKIKFLLKDQGMTINGVKKILNSKETLKLDEMSNNSIRTADFRNKLNKISKILKSLRE